MLTMKAVLSAPALDAELPSWQRIAAPALGTIIPMVSYSYRTNLDNCFDRSSCLSGLYEVDQEDVSARLTWLSPEQTWRVTAYGNNLTDERYVTGGTPLVDVTETAGTIYNDPRMYGVEVAYEF